MTRSRWLLVACATALSGILAFFLRDVVYAVLIVPAAYLFWVAGLIYSLIPQLYLWILSLIGLAMLVVYNFAPEGGGTRRKEQRRKRGQGQVEALAIWLARTNKGNYFKWQIANRLGLIARGLRVTSEWRSRSLSNNADTEKYLEAGLNTSFIDYPRPTNRFQRPAPTPLDLDPEKVVEYLELQMEMMRGRHP
jgi:hypothetical protein